MNLGNRDFDLADRLMERERAAGVARSRLVLAKPGRGACIDCGEPIEAARRRALPSASRCTDCQDLAERASRRKR